jgi:hypothetical protein
LKTVSVRWLYGVIMFFIIILIVNTDKLKSCAEVLGGIGSFLAFLGAIWLWQKSERNSKISETKAIFSKWHSLCLSCRDINNPTNYLSIKLVPKYRL